MNCLIGYVVNGRGHLPITEVWSSSMYLPAPYYLLHFGKPQRTNRNLNSFIVFYSESHVKDIMGGDLEVKPMSNFLFRFMSFGYRFRDLFLPRKNILN